MADMTQQTDSAAEQGTDQLHHDLSDLLAIMRRLRRDCAWDRKQTPQSLTKYAIEEAYEVEAAVLSTPQDSQHVCEELGDLLLQVIFQAQMYSEQGAFDFDDVVDGLACKLIRRHPHVFDPDFAQDADQVSALWQQIKQQEQAGRPVPKLLDAVKPTASLVQAQQLQQVAASVGFDWPDASGAWDKLNEEIAELRQAIAQQDPVNMSAELGDCLFSLVNVGRKLGLQADEALKSTNHRFHQRLNLIEQQLTQQGKAWTDASPEELDKLWDEAKRQLMAQQSL